MIPSIGLFYDKHEDSFVKGLKSLCKFLRS